ncbi:hypothetical protein Tco_1228987 [Tanacetum coccineum]
MKPSFLDQELVKIQDEYGVVDVVSQSLLGNSGPQSSTGDSSIRGDYEKMRVLALELIFALPCELGSSLRVLTNFDDKGYNSALVA